MSEFKVDKISPGSGTSITLGDSGDTFTIPSGVILAGDGSNLTGVAPTKATIEALGIELPAANLTGTIHADRYTDTVYTHPTTAGNKHIPTAGATDQVLTYSSSGTAAWADPAGGGKVLQMVGTTSIFGSTNISTTNNTWTDTSVTITFTPISATSKFLVHYGIMVQMQDSTGDGGYSIRIKRVQGATTVYPDGLTDYRSANMHSKHYHNAISSSHWIKYVNYSGVDHDSHTTSPVTYTIQGGHYNITTLLMGNIYNARPQMIVQEVEV